jgi:hypothetical protein
LLVLHPLDAIGKRRGVRKSSRHGRANSLRDLVGVGGTPVPLFHLELDGAAANRIIGARHDNRNAGRVRAFNDLTENARIGGIDKYGSNAGLRHDGSSQFVRGHALGAPSVQPVDRLINCLLI